jgi:hypothetical protein
MLQIQLRSRGFRSPFSGKLSLVTRIAKTSATMSLQAPAAAPASATAAASASAIAAKANALEQTAAVLDAPKAQPNSGPPREIGGREGLDPTRYGDWELRGRCIDF